ncbi:hypothetical protein PRIPAC_78299 [Pristionchus pacificus]|uniref:Uncharacterized protein n=1 Tax=Pristionchus pacificus TaxID=54126 RepID=A0A2A6BEE4_PRIPA|nr:hypothetical protein PRIPAC_78299 [Pristionchus pacificus]|eukprot:PDM64244.1 hypothetical protein PRIPAC_54488 [Pristionchus pacificus]
MSYPEFDADFLAAVPANLRKMNRTLLSSNDSSDSLSRDEVRIVIAVLIGTLLLTLFCCCCIIRRIPKNFEMEDKSCSRTVTTTQCETQIV